MSEGPWTIYGTIMTGIILLISVGILVAAIDTEFFAPKRRRRKRHAILEEPADVHFFITSTRHRHIDYAEQDEQEHILRDITLQSHSEHTVELHIKPRTDFTSTSTIFGCEHPDLANRPAPLEFDNPIVVKGDMKHGIPGKDPGHNILHHKHYQYSRLMHWNPGTHIIWGFKIKTEGPGVFQMALYFCGGEVEGKAELKIRVEDKAPIRMTCVMPGHDLHQIRPIFNGNAGHQ